MHKFTIFWASTDWYYGTLLWSVSIKIFSKSFPLTRQNRMGLNPDRTWPTLYSTIKVEVIKKIIYLISYKVKTLTVRIQTYFITKVQCKMSFDNKIRTRITPPTTILVRDRPIWTVSLLVVFCIKYDLSRKKYLKWRLLRALLQTPCHHFQRVVIVCLPNQFFTFQSWTHTIYIGKYVRCTRKIHKVEDRDLWQK